MMININKRQSELYEIIKSATAIRVNELIPRFDVSAATIRKDLTALEESGLIQRTHGEVHVAVQGNQMTPYEARSHLNIHAKMAIARGAVEQICDGDSIILDSGSTAAEIEIGRASCRERVSSPV